MIKMVNFMYVTTIWNFLKTITRILKISVTHQTKHSKSGVGWGNMVISVDAENVHNKIHYSFMIKQTNKQTRIRRELPWPDKEYLKNLHLTSYIMLCLLRFGERQRKFAVTISIHLTEDLTCEIRQEKAYILLRNKTLWKTWSMWKILKNR